MNFSIRNLAIVCFFCAGCFLASDNVNFGDNPNCKVISLQIHESNTAQSLHEEQNTIYSIVKVPGSSIDVNRTFPLRSNIDKHSSEPIGTVSPSGSVEYASISF